MPHQSRLAGPIGGITWRYENTAPKVSKRACKYRREGGYPKTAVQLCIVHMVRYSLNYVSWKLRKEIAADLRTIYAAATVEEAEQNLNEFEEKWGAAYAPIAQSWRRNWPRIIPFFDYPTSPRFSVAQDFRVLG